MKNILKGRVERMAAVAALAVALGAGVLAQGKLTINGAGATFPYIIYSKWFSEYNKMHPEVQINYQSQGSGFGIQQIQKQTVFFGATDGPMTADQMLAAPGKILHFPTVLGAVVPVYNIPGVTQSLKFTGPVLADIFLGKITKWNDAKITALNAGVNLPNQDITVAHRSDGSGTTYIWTDFLQKVSPDWKAKVGNANSVNWPVGLGAPQNAGVAGLVKQTPGAIGYVELIYAIQNQISYGSVQNMAGEFITASVESVTAAAAASAGKMPADFRVSIANADGKGVYPISSFTWLLVYENPKDKPTAKVFVEFMKWMLGDGQKFASQLGYAPLPPQVVKLELDAIAKIKVQ